MRTKVGVNEECLVRVDLVSWWLEHFPASSLHAQSWTRPPSLSSSLDTHKPEMPKIEEVSEQEKVISVTTTITTATTTTPTPTKFPESASATTTAVVPAPSVTALVSAPTITAPLPAISMKAESGVSISLDAIPPETPIVAVSKSCGSVVEVSGHALVDCIARCMLKYTCFVYSDLPLSP